MTLPRLLDTSIVSHYLAPDAPRRTPSLVQRVNEIAASDGARISLVTFYELDRGLRKLELRNQGSARRCYFAMFMSSVTTYGLDTNHGWELAADLHARAAVRAPAIVLEEADLLIFATALAHHMQLLTCDRPLAERLRELEHGERVEQIEVG